MRKHRPISKAVARPPLVLLVALPLLAAACTSSGSSNNGGAANPSASIRGQTITVLLPSWAHLPDNLVQEFEKQTGVKVQLEIAPWDSIRDKISVAGAAGSPLADVTEFDWSWTGQFGGAGWFVPLEKYLPASMLSDLTNTNAFTGPSGHVYGACYNNDFRLFQYNQKDFKQAGISGPPATWSQFSSDLATLKQKGVVQYPFGWPLEPTEDNSQAWYLITLAMGGQLFDAKFNPMFADPNSAGYKALNLEINALKQGYIEPGAVSMSNDAQGAWWRSGKAAITYAAPGDLVANEDPKQSSIVGQAQAMLVPGVNGPGNTYGLPEALGVMQSSQHKAAAIAFIKWWMEPTTQTKIYNVLGLLPCSQRVFEALNKAGKLVGGDVMLEELKHIVPLFPQGAPTWYTRFSTEAASVINAAAKGNMTVADALNRLAGTARTLASSGG